MVHRRREGSEAQFHAGLGDRIGETKPELGRRGERGE
jgi:hypothetical protein